MNSTDLFPADGSCLPDEVWNYETGLSDVVCTAPTLSVYQENTICKMDGRDIKGWMLPVDTGQKELDKAVPFSYERFYFTHNYMQLDFSKYRGKATEDY